MGTNVKDAYFKAAGFSGTEAINTPENRARIAPYSDPVTLNFKWMINWSKTYGLFADESYTNSALAYLKRIGETTRYNMLKIFIEKFTEFIKEYDFLILEVEGLESIFNRKPYEYPSEGEDKLIFNIRETVDLRIQALISLYKEIWFDNIRCVEILPANIRRFDAYVLIYNSGYYNTLLYDITPNSSYNDSVDVSKKIFPTLNKLMNLSDNDIELTPFNHQIIYVGDASFAMDESGKSFFSNLSNEMSSEYVKNTIGVTYNFCKTSGMFSNISGTINYGNFLSLVASYSNLSNTNIDGSANTTQQSLLTKLNEAISDASKDIINNVTDIVTSIPNKILGDITPIGNALDYFSDPSKMVGSVSDAINAGIDLFENNVIDASITNLHNLVSRNFSENMLTDYVISGINKTNIKIEDIKIEDDSKTPENIKYQEVISTYSELTQKNIKFEENRIYNRKTF